MRPWWSVVSRLVAGLLPALAPGAAAAQGLSPEVEAALTAAGQDRPLLVTEKDALVRQLRRRGVETVTDLHPYLGGPEVVRANALIAIERIGDVDERTLDRIEELAVTAGGSASPSVATAVRIVLRGRPRTDAMAFATVRAPHVHLGALYEIAWWLGAQDREWLADAADAAILADLTIERLQTLLATGTYSGAWPIRFAIAIARPPFDHAARTRIVARAFLTGIEHAGRLTDLRDLAFISTFGVVAERARVEPHYVEERLTAIVSASARPLTQLVLWRLWADRLAETDGGRRVGAAAVTRFPDLRAFADRLAAGARGQEETAAAIAAALAALPPPPEASADGTRTMAGGAKGPPAARTP